MEVKQLASQTLIGLKVRTCNANEMNAGTANIAELWQYFSSDDCRYERTYTSDFEYYKNSNEIEIAIAIKD